MSISPAIMTALQSLLVQQRGLDITGHNVANANTPNYSRQRPVLLAASPDYYPFGAIGRGVELRGVERVVDDFLNGQLRDGDSTSNSQRTYQAAYTQLQGLFNELTDNDLSTAMEKFFGSLHDLSLNVESKTTRDLVVQQGQSLREMIADLYSSIRTYHQQLDSNVDKLVTRANTLMDEIAKLNVQITTHEGGGRLTANDLRDQRDGKVRELAQILNATVIEQPNGGVNVVTKGMPLVMYDQTFHLTTKLGEDDQLPVHVVIFEADQAPLMATEGQLPATIKARDTIVKGFLNDLNQFASDLIYQFNRLHSQGAGFQLLTSVTSENAAIDVTVPLDQINMGFTPSPGTFQINNGSLTIAIVNAVSGEEHKYVVPIDLDGIGGNDTTLDDPINPINPGLVRAINNAVPAGTIRASTDSSGHLKIDSLSPNVNSFYFSEDTSGVLAALGINGFFSGHDAATIGISQDLQDNSLLLAAGKTTAPGDNTNLLDLITLRDAPVADNGTKTFEEFYRAVIGRLGVEAESTDTRVTVQSDLLTQLENQRQEVSGVSMDEEMTKMIQFQRSYQAAARLISTADTLLDTLINKM